MNGDIGMNLFQCNFKKEIYTSDIFLDGGGGLKEWIDAVVDIFLDG